MWNRYKNRIYQLIFENLSINLILRIILIPEILYFFIKNYYKENLIQLLFIAFIYLNLS